MDTTAKSTWSPPTNFEEFQEQFNTDSRNVYEEIVALLNRIRKERQDCRDQLVAAMQTIDNLEEQTTQLNLDLNIARAGHTSTAPIFSNTSPNAAFAFRSEKFRDPDKFNGTRAKLPGFLTQLRMKLEVNSDRFRNEAAQVIYAISCLEGRALDQVVPLVNSNPSMPFSSISAFIAHLEASFGDPDPRGTARRELVALKQGTGDFATYYSKFLRIISYLEYNEAAKMDALAEGLSEDLKGAMIYQMEKPISLEQYALTLMTIDNRIRGHKAELSVNRNAVGQFSTVSGAHPSHIAGGITPMDLSAIQTQLSIRPIIEHRYNFINGVQKTTVAEKYSAEKIISAYIVLDQGTHLITVHLQTAQRIDLPCRELF